MLARAYRERFTVPVIGITGSCGKTTTKELTALFMASRFSVLKNEGNFNNEIGVPKTLFGLNSTHTAAVIEMGMNHAGELTRLSRITLPTTAMVTNVEPVHLEFFDSVEDIARAKAEIFSSLTPGSQAVINGDSAYASILRSEAQRHKADIIEFTVNDITLTGERSFKWQGVEFSHALPGAFNRMNIIAALTAARVYGISAEDCARALASFTPVKDRMQVVPFGNSIIINDTYNSNPTALKAMLDELASYRGYERIAVIGDMKELGANSRELHRSAGEHINTLPIEAVFTFGSDAAAVLEAVHEPKETRHFTDRDALADAVRMRLSGKAAVLLKASHSMGFSAVFQAITERRS